MKDLLIATRNQGKVRELSAMLGRMPLRLRSLSEFPETPEPEETGTTFTENAALKARFYAAHTGLWALADDSGLEVDALGGAPGVHSARYAGRDASDAERTSLLLHNLERTKDRQRRARFVCVIAIHDPFDGALHTFSGTCEGSIAARPRGTHGFGYDPVFVPSGYEQTFGELSAEVKQHLSHRARALQSAIAFLEEHLRSSP